MSTRAKAFQTSRDQTPLSIPRVDLAIVYRVVEELKLDGANPRRHSKKQIRKIAASITTFGFIVPVLIDRHNNVIAGHGRLLACRELGISEAPTLCLDHLTPPQIRAFMIADNRLSEIATWDDRLVAEQLRDLSLLDLDFSVEVTGFEVGEIDLRIASLDDEPEPETVKDPRDVMTEGSSSPPVNKVGDLWQLGRHRVLCGNALDRAPFARLMGEERAAIVFTSPPYRLPVDGLESGLRMIHNRSSPMAPGEMRRSEVVSFLAGVCRNLTSFSLGGSLHFVCMDWRHMDELLAAGREVYDELKNLCVWVKDNAGAGSLYQSQHELVFVFKQCSSVHCNNVQRGQFSRNRSDVWHYAKRNASTRRGAKENRSALHPTVKPVAMVADAILDCSARGDIVLDPFLGSGNTLIACERARRRCYGLEHDPACVDTIIRRWQATTGDIACDAASGRSFDDLAREAEVHDGA
jgi:DNA modification methylase